MNIYLLSQSKNTGYDTWDSCVVIAKDEDEARMTHPYYRYFTDDPNDEYNKLIEVMMPGVTQNMFLLN